jgi:hypothetical protein
MVFAQAYAAFLNYFDTTDTPTGDWTPFFSKDVSVQLAVAAIQDVDDYKAQTRQLFIFLADLDAASDLTTAKDYLGYLFSCLATLATQLDTLKAGLPPDIALKTSLQNAIVSQLAPAFARLIAYYKADLAILPPSDRLIADAQPGLTILGATTVSFSQLYQGGLSADWITDGSPDWNSFTTALPADASVYGSSAAAWERINHIATHNLFTAVFDLFLRTYARTVSDASRALQATFTGRNDHLPHYALFLAFLRLFVYARQEMNTVTGRHLDFYYREILRLKETPSQPGKAHLLVQLAKQAAQHLFPAGELFQAGKDDLGKDAFFANDRDMVANQATIDSLRSVYRHGDEKVGVISPSSLDQGRIYASPIANSDDGLGAPLTTEDQSWHPFHNKTYQDGALAEIDMPKAEVGFALASHYLLLAQGTRTLEITFHTPVTVYADYTGDVTCYFTSPKGWLAKPASVFASDSDGLMLVVELTGADPAIVPYAPDTHGYNFATVLPVMLVKLQQQETAPYSYPA